MVVVVCADVEEPSGGDDDDDDVKPDADIERCGRGGRAYAVVRVMYDVVIVQNAAAAAAATQEEEKEEASIQATTRAFDQRPLMP